MYSVSYIILINTLRPRRNEQHFADDIFKRIFFDENVWISITIPLKFVPKGPINNIPALVQIMAWRRSGDKPLSEPMMVSLPTHICVTRPQWVKIQLFCVPRCGQLCQFNCNALFVKVCRPIHIFCIQHFFLPNARYAPMDAANAEVIYRTNYMKVNVLLLGITLLYCKM